MEWVETTGRTVADALDAALDELGVHEDEVEYEVITEPKGGLFRRGEARLRARVKPVSREKPGESRRRGRRDDRDRSTGSDRPARSRPASRGENKREAAPAAEKSAGSSGPRRRRRGGSGGGRPREGAEGAERSERGKGANVSEVDTPIEEQAEVAATFVRGLVEVFGAPAHIDTKIDEDVIELDVVGDDLGLMVGPRGVTLTAIEELSRSVLQRHTGGHGARLRIDVGGYKAKRREALAAFTREVVERVLETGKETALEAMPASDRKVVHDTVTEIDGVSTTSEGEEPRRRVVIRRS